MLSRRKLRLDKAPSRHSTTYPTTRLPDIYLLSSDAQLKTTAMDEPCAVSALFVGRGIRKRWPSADTAYVLYGCPAPPCGRFTDSESNSSRGAPCSSAAPLGLMSTAIILPNAGAFMKNSSRESPRQRGNIPPLVEICHLPFPGGYD